MRNLFLVFLSGSLMSHSTPTVSAAEPVFPDPLQMQNGTPVRTPEDWNTKRKPELKQLFQEQMYGRYPTIAMKPANKVVFEDPQAFDGLATLREVELSFGFQNATPMRLLIVIPNTRPAAGAPVFVGLNFSGNHTLVDDPRVTVPTSWIYDKYPGVKDNRASAEGRGKSKSTWPLQEIVKAGYAVVTCYNGDIDPDTKNERKGLRPNITPNDMAESGTIMCWAWGVHRMVDYVHTEKMFDAKRIAAVGHSRLGKTALLAGAFDERIAVVFPHQAGCGGTAPSRHSDAKAESVKVINKAFPHWFNAKFKTFGEDPEKLPIDQHQLLALCAPRPVLYTNATEDLWANPSGQFAARTGKVGAQPLGLLDAYRKT
jgi:hypothetical protein